jgi:hypothetical protein
VPLVQTTYLRAPAKADRTGAEKSRDEKDEKRSLDHIEHASATTLPRRAPSYISQLRIWHGTFSDEPLWRLVLRPLPFMLSPIVRYL